MEWEFLFMYTVEASTNVPRSNKFYNASPSENAKKKIPIHIRFFIFFHVMNSKNYPFFFILSCYLTKCPIHHCLQENKRTHRSSDCGPVCVPKKVEK